MTIVARGLLLLVSAQTRRCKRSWQPTRSSRPSLEAIFAAPSVYLEDRLDESRILLGVRQLQRTGPLPPRSRTPHRVVKLPPFWMRPQLKSATLAESGLMQSYATPVAAAFLERLLFDTDAIEAIGTLSSIWSCRARPQAPRFGLSEAEYLVQLGLIYSGEVSNGGHSQFFLNRGGRTVSDTVKALTVTELYELAAIFQRACATFPSGAPPLAQADVENELDHFTEVQSRALGELDREAFRHLVAVDTQLLKYARTNRNHILVPETPLDLRVGRCAV